MPIVYGAWYMNIPLADGRFLEIPVFVSVAAIAVHDISHAGHSDPHIPYVDHSRMGIYCEPPPLSGVRSLSRLRSNMQSEEELVLVYDHAAIAIVDIRSHRMQSSEESNHLPQIHDHQNYGSQV